MKKKLTPLKAIRARCLDCHGNQVKEVRECPHSDCPLFPYRMGKGGRAMLKPIRAYCLECCGEEKREVKLCTCSENCPLWAYRFGRRPKLYP